MSEREQLPEPPKRPGFKEYSLLKKILVVVLNIVASIAVVVLLLVVLVFHEYIESIGFAILFIVVVVALPILFVVDYVKKKRRIEYLEEVLREHNISFRPSE